MRLQRLHSGKKNVSCRRKSAIGHILRGRVIVHVLGRDLLLQLKWGLDPKHRIKVNRRAKKETTGVCVHKIIEN